MFPTADSDYQTQHQDGGWKWTTPWSSREAAIQAPPPLRAGIPYLMIITPSYVLDQVSLQIHTGLPPVTHGLLTPYLSVCTGQSQILKMAGSNHSHREEKEAQRN